MIRPAAPEDAAALAAVIRASFQDVAERFGLTPGNCPGHPSNCTEDRVRRDMAKGIRYFLLEEGGQAAGCVALDARTPGWCELERLAVLPACRRRGFGAALVRHVFREAAQAVIPEVRIGIIDAHAELKDWYRRLGFTETGVRDFPHLPFRVAFLARRIP